MNTQANHLNKYLELPKTFYRLAVDIDIAIKQSERMIEDMVKRAHGDEQLADMLIKTAELNGAVNTLLKEIKAIFQEVAYDAKAVMKGAELRNQMRDQWETIQQLQTYRDDLIKQLYECTKAKGTTKQTT